MITVIIPLYNSKNTIVLALDSVRHQTAIDMISEIIVVNDGSTDGSESAVENYCHKFPVLPITLITQKNGGAASARNCGLKRAKTQYVAFLDADDIWLPQKIERQMQVIRENPQIRFLGTGWEDTPLKIGWKKITNLYNGTVRDVCIKNFPVTPSILMETSYVDEVGYFDESRRYAEDINYFQKIAAKGNYYFLPEKLVDIDIGKDYFAQNGLSSNLSAMHHGTLLNIKELRDAGSISFSFWLLMRVFYQLKYYRRVILKYLNSRK